ncbi:MAG: tripartite tricarboxylate transporter TctB family protein [Desulfovibrionaceae bacterium]|nr:tripartite tricarboxylate transporter TctB family protein [Desulfovibrionaceae bacterium]
MKCSDFIVIAGFYLICLIFYVMIGTLAPEAQTYPTAIIVGLLILNTIYFGKTLRLYFKQGMQNDLPKIFAGFQTKQFLVIFSACLLYLIALPWLGFYISTLLFFVVSLLFLKVPKLHLLLTIVVMAILIYSVFTLFLKVPLPKGFLFS